MKRILSCVTLLTAFLIFAGCSAGNISPETEEPSQIVKEICGIPPPTSDLNEMDRYCDYIVIGKISDVYVERLSSEEKMGEKPEFVNDEERMNFTRYKVEVLEPIKGDFQKGDIIQCDASGGTFKNITEIVHDNAPFPEEGTTYLLFVNKNASQEGIRFNYYAYHPYEGILELYGDRLIAQKYSLLWKKPNASVEEIDAMSKEERAENSYTLDEAKALIKAAMEYNG